MSATESLGSDEQKLAELGYKQELNRGWSGFSNFAISFSIICILAGCFTTYGQALKNGGPIAIAIAWPLICVLILAVAVSMSELASAYPTAGGIYYWASRLGGPGWGWFTGWFNLIGLVAVVASVVYVSATFLINLLGLYEVNFIFNFVKAAAGTNVHYSAHVNFAMFVIIAVMCGLINVFSRHLISLLYNVSAWWNIIGVLAIVVILIAVPSHHASLSYVFSHKANESGFAGGATSGLKFWIYILPLGFLLTMYTITATTPRRTSPRRRTVPNTPPHRASGVRSSTRRSSAGSCFWRSRSRSRRATKPKSTRPDSRRWRSLPQRSARPATRPSC